MRSLWTNLKSGQLQSQADGQLEDQWGSGDLVNPPQQQTLELGGAFARMYTPAFGSDFHFVIIEGTEEEELLAGPGYYVDTQMPGEAGNLAVEGHRVGKGESFSDLGGLEVCDAIVVET